MNSRGSIPNGALPVLAKSVIPSTVIVALRVMILGLVLGVSLVTFSFSSSAFSSINTTASGDKI